MNERTLPHSLEAEKAVIGAVLVHAALFERVRHLKPEAFFRDAHRRVWAAIAYLTDERKIDVDLLTLKDELSRRGELDEVGGPAYLASLTDGVPRSSNAAHYAEIIQEKANLRKLIALASTVLSDAYDAEAKAETIITSADRAIIDLQRGAVTSRLVDTRESSQSLYADLEYRVAHRGEIRGIDTGFESINEMTSGWQRSDLIVEAARPSIGKAQPVDAPVLMASGKWKPIGDLSLGDDVASSDGQPSKVCGLFPQGVQPIYRVKFVDGRSVETTAEHLWATWTSRRVSGSEMLTTAEIAQRLTSSRYTSRLGVPLISGIFGGVTRLHVDPWLMGFLLGDGSSLRSSLSFSTEDSELVARVRAHLPPSRLKVTHIDRCNYRITSGRDGQTNPLIDAMRAAGAWDKRAHEKSVPDRYFSASLQDRTALLQGLMDTDGWAQPSACFSSTSRQLALDVQRLARSIGAIATMRQRATPKYRYGGQDLLGRPAYTVIISDQNPSRLFSLERKKVRTQTNHRRRHLTIQSVERVGDREAVCIAVTHPTQLYVTNDYTVTHNTMYALNTAVAAARLGKHVAIFSLEMRRRQLEHRMLSNLSGVKLTRIMNGYLGDEEFKRLAVAMESLSHMALWVDDRGGQTVWDIRSSCRRLRSEHGLDLVIVDYVQLMPGTLERRGANRHEEVTDIARRMKELADEVSVPIILLSQLSRASDARDDKRPRLSDLRESGGLEEAADLVCFLHRKHHRESGTTAFILEKHRNGDCGTRNLTIDRDVQTFTDGGADEPTIPETAPAKSRPRKFQY